MGVIAQSWQEVGAPHFHNAEVLIACRYAGDALNRYLYPYIFYGGAGGIGSPAYRILTDLNHGGYGDTSIMISAINNVFRESFVRQAQYELGKYSVDEECEELGKTLAVSFLGEEPIKPNMSPQGRFLSDLRMQMVQFHKFCTEYKRFYFNPQQYDWYGGVDQNIVAFKGEVTEYYEEYISDYHYEMKSKDYEISVYHDARGGYLNYGPSTALNFYTKPGGYYRPGGMSVKKWKVQILDDALELVEFQAVINTTKLTSSRGVIDCPYYMGSSVPQDDVPTFKVDLALMAKVKLKNGNKWVYA